MVRRVRLVLLVRKDQWELPGRQDPQVLSARKVDQGRWAPPEGRERPERRARPAQRAQQDRKAQQVRKVRPEFQALKAQPVPTAQMARGFRSVPRQPLF